MASRRAAASSAGNSPRSRAVSLAADSSRGDWGSSGFILIFGSWHDSVSGEFIGDAFPRVVQQVTNIPHSKTGAGADFLVGRVLVELQANPFSDAMIKTLQA